MPRSYWRVATVIYCGIVAAGSLTPVYGIENGTELRDIVHNFLHVPAYSVMTFLFVRSFNFQERAKKFFYAFTSALLLGALIEVLQGYVPGRDTSVWDLGLNICGIVLALVWVQHNKLV